MRHEDTAAALAAAMRSRVRDVEADDAFLDAVASRARQPRHGALTVLGAAAAALVVVGGGVAVGRVADPPRDAVPATSAPPTTRPTEAPKRPRVVATRVPKGWDARPYSVTSTRAETRGEGVTYAETVVYRPTRPVDHREMTTVRITTTSGAVRAVEASVGVTMRYDGTVATERVRPIRIGDRLVYPLSPDHHGSDRGFFSYQWTEAPGVNVSLLALGRVTEAEARSFVRNARLAGS